MSSSKRVVFVIDDDPNVGTSVCALAQSMGYEARAFTSAEAFLSSDAPNQRGVVVVDLRMPGMSGLELQDELHRRKSLLPVIVLSAYARTQTTVRAMKAGAVTVVDKPYHDDDLWDAIRAALEKEQEVWTQESRRQEFRQRLATLTPDERRVADLVLQGLPNKAIASALNVAIRTVEKRRHEVLAKMKVKSVAELVRAFHEAGEST
jgi:RNA polymerase sigma factor (sigma-70 family)